MRNECRIKKGLIIHPGAIGDAVCALPLAIFMKEHLGIHLVDWIGRTDYVQYFPTRTAVDAIRSIDAIPLHRLFEDPKTFELADKDPLLYSFAGYEQVVSFLGGDYTNFEENLLYTVHCIQSAHVITLPVVPNEFPGHISDYYIWCLAKENELDEPDTLTAPPPRIEPTGGDFTVGYDLLDEYEIDPDDPLLLIHPGGGGTQKCWPLDNFLQLAESLLADGKQVIFLLGPVEQERFTEPQLEKITPFRCLSQLDLTQLLQILAICDALIGNDSGITHMAAAMGKPTIAVFGPTNPQKFAPRGLKSNLVIFPEDEFTDISPANVERVHQEILKSL